MEDGGPACREPCSGLAPASRLSSAAARRFTREELRRCDGRDGAPVCFAYRGEVYDATASWQWRGGRHQVIHVSGGDLAEGLERAPHGEDLLARLPVIGVLVD